MPAEKVIKKGYYIAYVWRNGIYLKNNTHGFIILSKEIYKESPFLKREKGKKGENDWYISQPLISSNNEGIGIKFDGAKSFYLK